MRHSLITVIGAATVVVGCQSKTPEIDNESGVGSVRKGSFAIEPPEMVTLKLNGTFKLQMATVVPDPPPAGTQGATLAIECKLPPGLAIPSSGDVSGIPKIHVVAPLSPGPGFRLPFDNSVGYDGLALHAATLKCTAPIAALPVACHAEFSIGVGVPPAPPRIGDPDTVTVTCN